MLGARLGRALKEGESGDGCAAGCGRRFAGPGLWGWGELLNGLKCRYGGAPRARRRAGGGDRLCVTGVTHVRVAFSMG